MRQFVEPVPASSASVVNSPSILWSAYDALTELSVSLAIVGSIANASVSGLACQYDIGSIRTMSTSTDNILRAAQVIEADPIVDQAIVHALQRLAMLISFARNMTNVLNNAGAGDLAPAIADSWSRAASACVVAGILIERELPIGLMREPVSPVLGIRRLLREVCGGAAPCIDTDGSLRIPGWADRRTEARCEARKPVRIICNGVEGSGIAHNVSTNGMRVSASFTLPVGAWVTIVTPDNLSLEGQVVWSEPTDAGIELARPIDPVRFIDV